jgi:hypothetical protein
MLILAIITMAKGILGAGLDRWQRPGATPPTLRPAAETAEQEDRASSAALYQPCDSANRRQRPLNGRIAA